MALLWLPFYALGGTVGPNRKNQPLDVALFTFSLRSIGM